MRQVSVTLYNQFAECGISALGGYSLEAYRRACAKAGKAFTQYRGDCSTLDDDFAPLIEDARKRWRCFPHGAFHIAKNGLGVEIRVQS